MVSLQGRHVYLDANTVIYALEGLPQYLNLRAGLLVPLDERLLSAVTSQLTLLETIVFPRRNGDLVAEQTFRTFLTPATNLKIAPIDMVVIEKTIELRAQYPALKTPDAIHLATGILAGCDLFITRDAAWSKVGVEMVNPIDIG